QPRDLCLVLLSGGGSALLPAPVAGISLSDKQAVTRFLMSSGATINELNTVRKRLSRVKGGGLARACRQGRLISLIISDVVGDPLDIIASGPTILDTSSPQLALEILNKFHAAPPQVPQTVFDVLQQAAQSWVAAPPVSDAIKNVVIGNNAVALQAAAEKAVQLGYEVRSLGSDNQGEANAVGRDLARRCLNELTATARTRPVCFLSGGEPIVHLTPINRPRKGGRNQQLVLSALIELRDADLTHTAILSGGTDGEDGPTDAAGAYLDNEVRAGAIALGLDPQTYLDACDAYSFFEPCAGLIKTGPTHTNVMDLRVALVR
ncbi:MAG: D-glycerate 2-kinase, partial [Planctomycetaceae bacterium]|nr:D-glycerate 2-kinase [Planctomycetaceae bacterium]